MHTRSCARGLFSTAVPVHQAAYFRSSASSLSSKPTSLLHNCRFSMLFALSMFSMSISKSSKACTLCSREGSGLVMSSIFCTITSASDGPPSICFRISGSMVDVGVALALGSFREASEFSMPHLSRLFRPGSFMVAIAAVWNGSRLIG